MMKAFTTPGIDFMSATMILLREAMRLNKRKTRNVRSIFSWPKELRGTRQSESVPTATTMKSKMFQALSGPHQNRLGLQSTSAADTQTSGLGEGRWTRRCHQSVRLAGWWCMRARAPWLCASGAPVSIIVEAELQNEDDVAYVVERAPNRAVPL